SRYGMLFSCSLSPYTTLFRSRPLQRRHVQRQALVDAARRQEGLDIARAAHHINSESGGQGAEIAQRVAGGNEAILAAGGVGQGGDRKSTRLNSSHVKSSYAVF